MRCRAAASCTVRRTFLTLALTLTLTLTPTPTPTLSLTLTLTQSRRLAELIPGAQLRFFAGGHGFATSNPAVVPFLSD